MAGLVHRRGGLAEGGFTIPSESNRHPKFQVVQQLDFGMSKLSQFLAALTTFWQGVETGWPVLRGRWECQRDNAYAQHQQERNDVIAFNLNSTSTMHHDAPMSAQAPGCHCTGWGTSGHCAFRCTWKCSCRGAQIVKVVLAVAEEPSSIEFLLHVTTWLDQTLYLLC